MKIYTHLLLVLKSFVIKCEFMIYPIDIFMIILNMIIKLTPSDTIWANDGSIIIRHRGDIYVHNNLLNIIKNNLETECVPHIPFMKKITNKNVKMVKNFGYDGLRYMYVQIQNDLYSMGYCINGSLGTNVKDGYDMDMQKIVFLPHDYINDDNIDIDSNDRTHTVIFNGDIYCWGYLYKYATISAPVLIGSSKYMIAISVKCGLTHYVVLTNEGSVYVHECYNISSPIKMPIQGKVISISCGNFHYCALTEEGRVYGWGDHEFYQLEVGRHVPRSDPISLSIFNVKNICCCDDMTFVITNDDELYACGKNINGELGLGHTQNVIKLTKVPIQRVKHVAHDGKNTFILTNDKVYRSGTCNKFEEIIQL